MSGAQSRICSGDVASLQHEDITRHDPVGRHHDAVAVPHDPGAWSSHRAQRHHRTLRPVFLKEPDDRIEDHDRADRDGIEPFPKGRGQHSRHEEEPDHGARKLTNQQRESTGRLLATNFVRTEFRQSALRFGRRKAAPDGGRRPNTSGLRSERQARHAAPSDVATASCGGETAIATRT